MDSLYLYRVQYNIEAGPSSLEHNPLGMSFLVKCTDVSDLLLVPLFSSQRNSYPTSQINGCQKTAIAVSDLSIVESKRRRGCPNL